MDYTVEDHRFSKWRAIIFPVLREEVKLFCAISLLLFSILFNQSILRILKNSLIISEISVEVISFIKIYCVTPVAGLMVILYTKMVNRLSLFNIFYIFLGFFSGFYVFFGFVIYPNISVLHLSPDATLTLMEQYPYYKWFIAMFANWSYIIFYVLSELWPNIFYILLFWQICNHISTLDQARRFYRICALLGNFAVIIAGIAMQNLASPQTGIYYSLGLNHNNAGLMQVSSAIILINSVVSILCVKFISLHQVADPVGTTTKPKMGLKESFKYIANSKYLWMMLICSAAFGLSMNLIEALWYSKIKQLYPSLQDYTAYNSSYVMWTGGMVIFFTIFGGILLRYFGWFVTTLLTPIVILITGAIFFLLAIFVEFNYEIMNFAGGLLGFTVMVGTIQNVLSKGIKYSIWDSFREMLYIPLDKELKTKGKAAVDLLSSKIGKALSSGLQSVLFMCMPCATYDSIGGFMLIFFTLTCIAWIWALYCIRDEYNAVLLKNDQNT